MRGMLFALLFICSTSQAQVLVVGEDTLDVSADQVRYRTSHLDTTISRDLLAAVPIGEGYQWVDDDLGWILLRAREEGKSVPFVPAADTSLWSLLDSLEAIIDMGSSELAELRVQNERMRQENDAHEVNITALNQRVVELETELADYRVFVEGVRAILRRLLTSSP